VVLAALVVAICGGASALDLALCGLDKRAARRGSKRVPERTLLLVALAGGSPGLALGMLAFRHKTRKPSFLAKLALVLAVQAAAAFAALRLAG
jgi:uncharacterized membrane protein YsdA (DUF1294 family)